MFIKFVKRVESGMTRREKHSPDRLLRKESWLINLLGLLNCNALLGTLDCPVEPRGSNVVKSTRDSPRDRGMLVVVKI